MKFIASLIFGLFFASTSSALHQDWREIKPIESTCKDVERVFGGEICGKRQYKHRLPSAGMLYIDLAHDMCRDTPPDAKRDDAPGVVTRVFASLYGSGLFISDLSVDESKLKSGDAGDQLGVDVYVSEELGISMETTKEKEIITLTLFPAARYRPLCGLPLGGDHPARANR